MDLPKIFVLCKSYTLARQAFGYHRNWKRTAFYTSTFIFMLISGLLIIPSNGKCQTSDNSSQNLTSIYDIQFSEEASGDSPFINQVVTVTGTITGLFDDGYTIAEESGPWKSIFIHSDTESPSLMQQVQVTGTVQEYYGMTQISTVREFSIISDIGVIEPIVIEWGGCRQIAQDDVAFCLKCARRGIKVHVDCDCVVEHLL